ncbi:hypothetical protein BC939DRAFT_436750, partial [Gamsiella multidivaricata]|uniref:uncharacterized protein n=1 Tax=Gamsiella multidivaricata TaxID=101098 RepID=UPI00221F490F
MILCLGRFSYAGIMPQAETDIAIPWAIVCLLLLLTGAYGLWVNRKGSTWHHLQFVSACWGFLLMLLCWGVVYIAVEMHHVKKVNEGCMYRNASWTLKQCDDRRKTAGVVAIVLAAIGMLFGIYFTLVLNVWVSSIEWTEYLENERRLAAWRSGKAENPHIEEYFQVDGAV